MKALSSPRFLAIYSGVLTVAFAATVLFKAKSRLARRRLEQLFSNSPIYHSAAKANELFLLLRKRQVGWPPSKLALNIYSSACCEKITPLQPVCSVNGVRTSSGSETNSQLNRTRPLQHSSGPIAK